MPYCTMKMAKYMKEKGLSQVSDDGSNSTDRPKKKLREVPSGVSESAADEASSAAAESSSSRKASKTSGASSSASTSASAASSAASAAASKTSADRSRTSSSSSKARSRVGSSTSSKTRTTVTSSASGSKAASSTISKTGSKTGSAAALASPSASKASSKPSSSGSSKAKSCTGVTKPASKKWTSSASSVTATAKPRKTKASRTGSGSHNSHVSLGGISAKTPSMSFDERKLLYIKGLLRSQVKRISMLPATIPVDKDSKTFENYTIDESKPLGDKPCSCQAMVKATHKQYSDYVLLCKIYDCKTLNVDPNTGLFFKILRHMGKKHPSVIQTWDVLSRGNIVYVLQEFSVHGPMDKYLANMGNGVDESTAKYLAKQLFMAMDYMGDMGIAHRAIYPGHILVTHKDLIIKLTGFRSSVVYWNIEKEDINFMPCFPASARPKEGDFQALEVYGDPEKEEFDPVSADIWSFGACVYYFLTRKYPFDPTKENPNVDSEVIANIESMKVSKAGKKFLRKTLSTFANVRIQFDHINQTKWLKGVNV